MAERLYETVLGPVPEGKLGHVQCHEHLLISRGRSFQVNHALFMDDLDKSAAEAAAYRASGGGTVVDAQPVGCGRMAQGLRHIARASGVNIIASTGFHKMVFYQEGHWIYSMGEEELTRLFIRELTCGMYGTCDYSPPQEATDIRAGIIKTALDVAGLTPQYEKLFRAASQASLETGAPMMVHIEPGSDPAALLKFLLLQGLSPERLIFCHTDRNLEDAPIRRGLLEAGVFLELDTIGRYKYHSDLAQARLVTQLLEEGWRDKLLLSLDTTRLRLRSYEPTAVGLCHIIDTFIPLLQRMGAGDEDIAAMCRVNPAEVLCFS